MDQTGGGTICLLLCAVGSLAYRQGYVNVALNKTYTQSSRIIFSNFPSRAANGNTDGRYIVLGVNCIRTSVIDDLNPWWEVDLGRTYPVHDITVWPRTGYGDRLNSSIITVDGETCASITSFRKHDKKKNVTCTSVMQGQKVRITRHPTPQQAGYDRTLNLCELQIWVCEDGLYGDQCSKTCSPGCQNTACDRLSGQCSPCTPGYTGNRCSVCVEGLYGDQCSKTCSPGCQNTVCDRLSGKCSPCTPGYTGNRCSVCEDGLYGDQCSKTCSPGCQNTVCDRLWGKCSPCTPGYTGNRCSVCVDGLYGDQCSKTCSPGCQNTACDHLSGQCSPCTPGYTGDWCSECQDTYYKTSSGMCVRCSSNCQSPSCDKETGTCNGCVAGWYGDQCSIHCSSGCQDTICGQQTGLCSPCKPGYTGNTCTVDTDNDKTFGTAAFIGSVIGAGLLGVLGTITICVMRVRRSRRAHENMNTTNELGSSTSPASATSTAPADRGQEAAVFQGVPDQEGQYEIVGDIPMTTRNVHPGTSAHPVTTTTHVHPGTSTHPDTTSHVTEADNPYDLPAELYSNTGELHLYDH